MKQKLSETPYRRGKDDYDVFGVVDDDHSCIGSDSSDRALRRLQLLYLSVPEKS